MKKFCDMIWFVKQVHNFNNKYRTNIELNYLKDLIKDTSLGGNLIQPTELIDKLVLYNLIILDKSQKVSLSENGEKIIKCNNTKKYILNCREKSILANEYIRINKKHIKQVAECFFKENYKVVCKDSCIRYEEKQIIEDMKFLDIIVYSNNFYYLNHNYLWLYLEECKMITEVELNEQLIKNKCIGDLNEEFVLGFEINRLKSLNLCAQANKVKLVSHDFINAGFDILSFSDDSLNYNRYIEVKSVGKGRIFNWTINEIEMARLISHNYFLYLVIMKEPLINLVIVKNPIENLEKIAYEIKGTNYEVRIIDNIFDDSLVTSFNDIKFINI
ncbi:DUF3883 domain-containing protein [Clostridium sp. SHJSY1]|uniref:DUF3883 domain-containing protein n=1 Tax=Clostridium sp. SHJSY1 TaxID=2942483 RepID=UPI0028758D8D|nr:DUF3883 domain-containing protein [Clostridium sp. SHJSY1]MDS0527144.1 DUF3883 domain-containing protein [Clostridium sp. SHJSY1]